MIDVGVTENDGVEGARIRDSRIPIPLPEWLQPLEQAAVEEDTVGATGDEVHRTRHRPRRAEKLNGRQIPSPPPAGRGNLTCPAGLTAPGRVGDRASTRSEERR